MTTCGAASRRCTRLSTTRPRSSPATALLTFAFDILARAETHPDPAVRIELVLSLARASGLGGMVGGQMLDLAAEGRFDGGSRSGWGARGRDAAGDEDRRAAEVSLPRGRHSRQGDSGAARCARPLRRGVGQAFQIADDLLDVEGDPALVGKQTGKDAEAGKATIVGILGVDGAKARLRTIVSDAEAALEPFGTVRRCPDRRREVRRRPQRVITVSPN